MHKGKFSKIESVQKFKGAKYWHNKKAFLIETKRDTMGFLMKFADTRRNKKLEDDKHKMMNQKLALVRESFNTHEKLTGGEKNMRNNQVPNTITPVGKQQRRVASIPDMGVSNRTPKATVTKGSSRRLEKDSSHRRRSSSKFQHTPNGSDLDGSSSHCRNSGDITSYRKQDETPKSQDIKGTEQSLEGHDSGHRRRFAEDGMNKSSRKLLGATNRNGLLETDSSHHQMSGIQRNGEQCRSNLTAKQMRMKNARRNIARDSQNAVCQLKSRQQVRSLSQGAIELKTASGCRMDTASNHRMELMAPQKKLQSTTEHSCRSLFGGQRSSLERHVQSSRSLNHSDHGRGYKQHHMSSFDVGKSRSKTSIQNTLRQPAGIPSTEFRHTAQQSLKFSKDSYHRRSSPSQLSCKEHPNSKIINKSTRDLNHGHGAVSHGAPTNLNRKDSKQRKNSKLKEDVKAASRRIAQASTARRFENRAGKETHGHTSTEKIAGIERVTEKSSAYTRSRRNRMSGPSSRTPATSTARSSRHLENTQIMSCGVSRQMSQHWAQTNTTLLCRGSDTKNWDDVD